MSGLDERGATTAGSGTPHPVDLAVERPARRSLAVLVAGPVVGMADFLLVYLVAEAGCTGGGPGLEQLGPPVPVVVTVAATLVAAVACLACAGWGVRRWRAEAPGTGEGSLALAGALLSGLFAVTVLMVGTPALVLGPC